MKRRLLLLSTLLLSLWSLHAGEQNHPSQEIRAVWLTTIYGLDWPNQPARNQREQQLQQMALCAMLDSLKAANFNTVFIQTRLRGDVIYPSKIEPFSKVFSGKYGQTPGYDPLAFAIEQCHLRGLECHAFFVTYPIGTANRVKEQGTLSVVSRHPDLCLSHRDQWYLDPGKPETSDYLLSLVEELVTNYDLDGIQFDYMRYPDQANSFPDNASFAKYGNGHSLADWRRDNINRLMTRIHDCVKGVKPWVQVSSSPLGKYRRTAQTPNASWTAYEDAFQDPKAWLKAEKQDMIAPMMYYKENDFYPFIEPWLQQTQQRNMVVGLGAYRLNKKEGDWQLSVISDQINYARRQGVSGCAFFRAKYVIDNEKGLYQSLKNHFFKYPAKQPPMNWVTHVSAPPSPEEPMVTYADGALLLSWKKSQQENDCTYTIYYAQGDTIDLSIAKSILTTGLRGNSWTLPVELDKEKGYLFCITATNRYRIESTPSHETFYYLSPHKK